MSYTKQTWQTGDTITAEKLNYIENGIADAGSGGDSVFIVNFVYDLDNGQDHLDKTFAEIKEAVLSGKVVMCKKVDSFDDPEYGYTKTDCFFIQEMMENHGVNGLSEYYVEIYSLGTFSATSDDGVLEKSD